MVSYHDFLDFFLENIRKVFYPEDWLKIDLSLSKTELIALLLIDRHQEVTMSQIADFLNVPMSTATGIIDRLVRKGYLKRDRSESDRRIVVIHLSDKGKTLLAEIKQEFQRSIGLVEDALTDEEKASLLRILTKVFTALSKPDRKPMNNLSESNNVLKKIEIE